MLSDGEDLILLMKIPCLTKLVYGNEKYIPNFDRITGVEETTQKS